MALYVPEANRLYVANGNDGSVRIFDASSYAPLKTLDYGDDADNLRYDSAQKRIYVGYGSGALGEIDSDGNKVSEIKVDAHPESFQLEKSSPRMYVNLPKSRKYFSEMFSAHLPCLRTPRQADRIEDTGNFQVSLACFRIQRMARLRSNTE